MAAIHPLIHAHPSDVTIERIRTLVQVGPESPVVEYKEKFVKTIARGVAALANTYGGLLLIGVTDDQKLLGVTEKTSESVAEHCRSKIEPPYVPEILPVALDQDADRYVLVLRVVPGTYPRPLLVDGVAWVRHHNTTHPADWGRLRDIFIEGSGEPHQEGAWNIVAPQLPRAAGGAIDETVDLVLRSGLTVAMTSHAMWRPLPESTVAAYINTLNNSPLAQALADHVISDVGGASINRYRHKGVNRSRSVRLEWSGSPSGWPSDAQPPVEACASLEVPGAYGTPGTRLHAEIDVIIRFSAIADPARQPPAPTWRITAKQLHELIDAMLATLTTKEVAEALAELADVDPMAMPQPRVMHLVTARPVTEVLDTTGLRAIPDAGTSRGAHLRADPARDLATSDDRSAQAKDWLTQIALDAGLLGTQQRVLDRLDR